jgi:hypothetical protein
VLRKTLGPKKDEVTHDRRKLHRDYLYNLFSLPNSVRIIASRMLRFEGHATRKEETSNAYNIFVVKPQGNRPLRGGEGTGGVA